MGASGTVSLADVATVRNAFDVTLMTLLAAITDKSAHFARGEQPRRNSVRTLVPV
jgi:hypothetical protein